MNVWSKLLTALRGGANEVGEALVDNQALRILDQEIRDCDEDIRKTREALAQVLAKQKLANARLKGSVAKIEEYEPYAIKALEGGNEALAGEVAHKISTLEISVADDRKQERELSQSVSELRKAVAQGEGHVKRLQQQVDTVKATESVYRAQMTVARRFGGSQATMQTAVESLERIKQKQAERKARMEADAELAAQESSDEALDAKLRGAGIAPAEASANSVLARLREKANV